MRRSLDFAFRFWSQADGGVMLDWGCVMQTAFNERSIADQRAANRHFTPLLYNLFSPSSDVTVMQWTGLFDSRGKQIFEGDVVDVWSAGSHMRGELRWGQGIAGFFIYNERTGQRWALSGGLPDYRQEDCTVLGNIFQNPELRDLPPGMLEGKV